MASGIGRIDGTYRKTQADLSYLSNETEDDQNEARQSIYDNVTTRGWTEEDENSSFMTVKKRHEFKSDEKPSTSYDYSDTPMTTSAVMEMEGFGTMNPGFNIPSREPLRNAVPPEAVSDGDSSVRTVKKRYEFKYDGLPSTSYDLSDTSMTTSSVMEMQGFGMMNPGFNIPSREPLNNEVSVRMNRNPSSLNRHGGVWNYEVEYMQVDDKNYNEVYARGQSAGDDIERRIQEVRRLLCNTCRRNNIPSKYFITKFVLRRQSEMPLSSFCWWCNSPVTFSWWKRAVHHMTFGKIFPKVHSRWTRANRASHIEPFTQWEVSAAITASRQRIENEQCQRTSETAQNTDSERSNLQRQQNLNIFHE